MARVVKTEKMSKKKVKVRVFVILFLVIIAGVLCFFGYKKFFGKKDEKQKVEIQVLDSIKDYGYSLSENDSDLFKTEYNLLKDAINENPVDISKYATQVAKLFVIDLYSLNSKVNKYDVGGKEYYHSSKILMFEQKVMDTIYSTLQDNSYGDRKQELPNVNKIDVKSSQEIEYTMDKEKVKGYQVKMEWTYDKNMGYDTKGTVVVCQDSENRWSVVDFQPTLEPKYK